MRPTRDAAEAMSMLRRSARQRPEPDRIGGLIAPGAGAHHRMRLLALDTATEWCSVAVWCDGELLHREVPAERGHGTQLLSLIDALLAEAGLGLGALDALAFGRGPGAFTGLRLAASVTQGLAFSAGLPVIPVSDLRALAQQLATPADPDSRVLVCHDARMGEVYWAGFSVHGGLAQCGYARICGGPQEHAGLGEGMDWPRLGQRGRFRICGLSRTCQRFHRS